MDNETGKGESRVYFFTVPEVLPSEPILVAAHTPSEKTPRPKSNKTMVTCSSWLMIQIARF
jgi:hypothetical protein